MAGNRYQRTKAAGGAESAPTSTDDSALVWLAAGRDVPPHERGAVSLLVTGANMAYELAYWDTNQATDAWTVLETGTLIADTPHTTAVPQLVQDNGALYLYVRSTGTTGADVMISGTTVRADAAAQVPHTTEAVDIGSGDHTFTLGVNSIFVGVGGDVIVRVSGDSTDRTYKALSGQTLFGTFTIVRQTGTTATNMIGQKS